MTKNTIIIIVIIVVILLVGGLYWFWTANSNTGGNPLSYGQTTTNTQATSTPVLILNTGSTFGEYLTAPNGMTLYTNKNDSYNVSTCTGTCATNWPPYTIPAYSNNLTGTGVNGIMSTITRDDGTNQVTYNGMPLYFYSKDVAPGDMNGNSIGGIWTVAVPPTQSGS
jgi:predicted lipoprotein with Yx(FWY)xxD motif